MSEMLANHYFMIRDYAKAVNTYESVITKNGISKAIRKKMIICYVKTFCIEKAFSEFYRLVEEDVHFIINTNLTADDCPCPNIISEIERDEIHLRNEYHKLISLGILWLYCDIKQSLLYLKRAATINTQNKKLVKIIPLIESKTKEQ